MQNSKEICDTLKLLRLKKGFSQEYLASLIGMTPEGYGKIERGCSKLSLDFLNKVCAVLDLHLNIEIRENSIANTINNHPTVGLAKGSDLSSLKEEICILINLLNKYNSIG